MSLKERLRCRDCGPIYKKQERSREVEELTEQAEALEQSNAEAQRETAEIRESLEKMKSELSELTEDKNEIDLEYSKYFGDGWELPEPSDNVFNESGKAIVCPIVAGAQEGPLHIRLKDSPVQGVVLCEQVRYLDLAARRYHKLTTTHYFNIMDISDAVVSMIEYQ